MPDEKSSAARERDGTSNPRDVRVMEGTRASWSPRDRWALGVILGAVVVGGLLRAAMARGDLWLDEVWSLELVRPLSSSFDVFTSISHDNNHFLNSLWLFWLGPARAPWAYRAPAVLLGTLSIPLAAAVVWRRSRAGAAAGALLVATAMPLVLYGSEARGYAGLIAATLLAFAAFERALDDTAPPRGARWLLGAAVGVGTLFHFSMLGTLAVLGLAALMRFAAERPLARAVDATLALFRPSILALLPAMAAVLAGLLHRGGFEVGNTSPGTIATFIRGYGDQFRYMLGAPMWISSPSCFVFAGLLLLGGLRMKAVPKLWRDIIFAAAVVLPAVMLLLRFPNLEFARYYLVPGLVLLLTVAELAGALWDGGTPATRVMVGVFIALLLVGQGAADKSALALGRGQYGETLAAMAGTDGHVRYATHDTFWVGSVARLASQKRTITVEHVPDTDFCLRPPDWFIDVPEDADDAMPATFVAGPEGCRIRFGAALTVRTNPLSGMRWNIYRRQD